MGTRGTDKPVAGVIAETGQSREKHVTSAYSRLKERSMSLLFSWRRALTATPKFSGDLHFRFLDMANIIFGAALALAASNARSVFGTCEPADYIALGLIYVVLAQIGVGILAWMMYTRDVLLFQRTQRAESDGYLVTMAIPLVFILLFFAFQPLQVAFVPAPWTMLTLFFLSLALLSASLRRHCGPHPILERAVGDAAKTSIALAIFFALIAIAAMLAHSAVLVPVLHCHAGVAGTL